MAKRNRKDRREARRQAYQSDRKQRDDDSGGWEERRKFLVDEGTREKLGIYEWRSQAGEDGKAVRHKLHLLPPHADDPPINSLPLFVHPDIGPNGESYLCPKKMASVFHELKMPIPDIIKDAKCPICEEHDRRVAHYRKVKGDLSQSEWEKLWGGMTALRNHSGQWNEQNKPKSRLTWVCDAYDEESEKLGVGFWLMPVTRIYNEGLLDCMEDPDDPEDGYIDPFDEKDGCYFTFKRKGEGLGTKYSGFKLTPRKWDDDEDLEWFQGVMDSVPRYDEVLVFHTYEEMEEALAGMLAEEANEEPAEEDEPRSRGRSRGRDSERGGKRERSRSRSRDRDDEDGEEDEPEERPRKSKGRHRDPEPDDDEPEEDARPRSSKRKRRPAPEPEADEDDDSEKSDAERVAERSRRRKDRQKNKTSRHDEEDD